MGVYSVLQIPFTVSLVRSRTENTSFVDTEREETPSLVDTDTPMVGECGFMSQRDDVEHSLFSTVDRKSHVKRDPREETNTSDNVNDLGHTI